MSCSTCSNCNGCGCDQCRPANTVYRGTCTDPGVIDYGTYIQVLDQAFCENRLLGGEGLLQSREDGSGNFRITLTESPQVDLPTLQAVIGTPIPNLIGIDSNDFWWEILGPASADQILRTNAAGQLYFGPIPAATVPDPLTIGTVNVTTQLTAAALTVTGATTLSGVAAGTITGVLGVNAANLVVTQSPASLASAVASFYESPTSPNAANPNIAITAGNNLVIGNLLYDSGLSIMSVVDSVTLKVLVAGAYAIQWCGQVTGSAGSPTINLLVNGINVNTGNGAQTIAGPITSGRSANLTGFEARALAVNDTIQLQLGSQSGAGIKTYAVRLVATRVGP